MPYGYHKKRPTYFLSKADNIEFIRTLVVGNNFPVNTAQHPIRPEPLKPLLYHKISHYKSVPGRYSCGEW